MHIHFIHIFLLSFNLLFLSHLSVASDLTDRNSNPTRREATLILHQCVQRLNNLRKIKEDMQVCNEANQILSACRDKILEYWRVKIGSNWPVEGERLEKKALKRGIVMLAGILHDLSKGKQEDLDYLLNRNNRMAHIFDQDCCKCGGVNFLNLVKLDIMNDARYLSFYFCQKICSTEVLERVKDDAVHTLYEIWLFSDKILAQPYQENENLIQLFQLCCIPPLKELIMLQEAIKSSV